MSLPLIVPLDGSASAERALPVAAAIGRRTGAPLHLIRVEPGVAPGRAVEPGMLQRPVDPQRRAAAGAYLGEAGVGLVEAGVGGAIITAQLEGPVVRAVVTYAREQQGLIVMAARGDGDPLRGPVGTATDRVVRWSGLPVVVVPVGGPQRIERWRCDRLLLAVDGSAPLPGVLEPVVQLAVAFEAAVYVASAPGGMAREAAWQPPEEFGREERDASSAEAAVRRLREADCTVELRGVRGRLDAREVLSLAALLDVDLIAMACADRADGGLLRYGSAISGILRRTTVPVLVHCTRSKVTGRPLVTDERSQARGRPAPAA